MQRAIDRTPFNRLLGLMIVRSGEGIAVVACDFREDLSQADGLVHGGVLASIADAAVAAAILPTLRRGESMATIDLSIQFLRRVPPGSRIEAEARLLRRGGTVAVGEVDVRSEDGQICAKSLMSYRIFKGNDAELGPAAVRS